MSVDHELQVLDTLLSFSIPTIPEQTHFWMIRTQKGYFYNEFIAKKFVALAWNNIDNTTDFSEKSRERLKDDIMMKYPEIARPSTVINKCFNFINEVAEGDILVIPSKGSKYITFAIAGAYYEDPAKTVELEKAVIDRIKNNNVYINDVSCPYKKRRKISLLRTIKSEDLNTSLYKAISSYHGINSLNNYAYQILNELYNFYTFQDYTVLVYNVRKTTSIKPRELSRLIYANTECLCSIIDEDNISTQINLHSPGDIVYMLREVYKFAKENWIFIFGLLVIFGGGSVLSVKVNGIVDIIKNILSTPQEIEEKKLNNESKEIDILMKRLTLYEKIKATGIDPQELLSPLEKLSKSAESLNIEPIIIDEVSAAQISTNNADEEYNDTEEE